MTTLGRTIAIFAAASVAWPASASAQQLTTEQAERAEADLKARYRDALAMARDQVADARRRERAERRLAKANAARASAQRELAQLGIAVPAAAPVPALAPAQAGAPAPAPAPAAPVVAQQKLDVAAVRAAADAEAENKATRDFGGLALGTGLSLTVDLGTRDRIAEATVVDGIVRIKKSNNTPARLLFESHYLFKPQFDLLGVESDMWGVGPFVAIQPGDKEVINAIGLGVMLAFRREPTKTDSFNLGFGVIIDPDVQLLGDGIEANKPLPTGETMIRYREDSQIGLMAMASFSF
ncbi:hypothetical protein M9979_12535 [Sphingomonas sp. RP10(2022)]|uniref:Outer membrane protein beta-barrel domain-containing protein n=1 Tax=Sphingomonas liriopis TaxID=2949094 RepID=A0A9X2KRK5_9SPHN|nr:hypothetical protein [Sphingomonas liriopis]MCP3735701.1 hypothetical protein [Sphingomonas liriopis]